MTLSATAARASTSGKLMEITAGTLKQLFTIQALQAEPLSAVMI
jgi:hypothetical protein